MKVRFSYVANALQLANYSPSHTITLKALTKSLIPRIRSAY